MQLMGRYAGEALQCIATGCDEIAEASLGELMSVCSSARASQQRCFLLARQPAERPRWVELGPEALLLKGRCLPQNGLSRAP